jgi:hypothetical protein
MLNDEQRRSGYRTVVTRHELIDPVLARNASFCSGMHVLTCRASVSDAKRKP